MNIYSMKLKLDSRLRTGIKIYLRWINNNNISFASIYLLTWKNLIESLTIQLRIRLDSNKDSEKFHYQNKKIIRTKNLYMIKCILFIIFLTLIYFYSNTICICSDSRERIIENTLESVENATADISEIITKFGNIYEYFLCV